MHKIEYRVYSPISHGIVVISFFVSSEEIKNTIDTEMLSCEDSRKFDILHWYKSRYEVTG